ncbi:hypothetical protein BDV93DRAFT_534733 [Ceratobasidium sp. AG-I]|nr:hypothetical protein BDV93DRAFT_534733 [Ceratobasidium sp. AG-I]
MFKQRRKGSSSAWPLILLNYNLHPSIRTRLDNIICVGVIPGPKEFVLHAFLIILFGDIPAISKLLLLKGQNAITPCQTCLVQGTQCQLPASVVYYVPLTAPEDFEITSPEDLLMRTHEEEQARERARISQESGLNWRPLVARLGSINLASCAPYDFMHLIFENLVPNMLMHWKGTFKWLDHAEDVYQMDEDVWAVIGQLTEQAMRTIPSQFVGTLPNIHTDGGLYKAEAHSFWFTYLAPILLNGRLDLEHYEHFLAMHEIIVWCLELEITHEEVDALE